MFFSASVLFAQQKDDVYLADSLKEVLITSDKKIVKTGADGSLIFDAKRLLEDGVIDNALDFFNEIPLITLNDDTYSLIGGGKASITINGRNNSMSQDMIVNYLSTIEPQKVKSISVYYRTPAKHGVNGASINVELHQNRSEDFNISGAAKTTMYQAKKFYPLGYLYGLLENSKWSLDLSYAIGQGKRTRVNKSYVSHNLQNGTHEVEMVDKLQQDGLAQRFTATLNYDIKGGILTAGYYFRKDDSDTGKPYSATDNGNDYFSGSAPLHSNQKSNTAFVDYKKKSMAFGFSSNMVRYENYQPNLIHFPNKSDFFIETNATQKANTYNIYANNSNELKYGAISYGAEFTKSNVTTAQSTSVDTRGDGDNSFNTVHHDYEVSTFLGWSQKIGKRIGLNADITMKYQIANQTTDNGEQESLWDRVLVLPGLNLNYKINKNNELQLDVTSSSNYPSFAQSSPRVSNSNYYFSSVGNPSLKPEQSYRANLSYATNRTYVFSIFYDISKDAIAQYFIPSSREARGSYQFTNLDAYSSYGISASAVKAWSNRFNQRWVGSVISQKSKGNFDEIEMDKTNVNFQTNLVSNIYLNKKRTFLYSITLLYTSKSLNPTLVYLPRFEARMAASYRLPAYGWEFSLRGNDIFGTAHSKFKSAIPGQITKFNNDTDSQCVIFTAKYTWRGYKEKKEKTINSSRLGI